MCETGNLDVIRPFFALFSTYRTMSLMAVRVGWIEAVVQISQFVEKLLSEDQSPLQHALASLGHSVIIAKISGGISVYHPIYKRPKKLTLVGSKLRSYFSQFVDQSSPN